MRRLFALFLITIHFLSIRVFAISAESAVLIDGNSGRVLFEKDAHKKMTMASTTKVMTGLLACESGKSGDTVTVSAFASGTEGSSLWLKPGEKLTLEDLVYGLMLKSGNDAAVVIAEFLAGNVDAFSLMMTQRAQEIGAHNTSFKNPHGLDAEEHYTTAYDLAVISKEAMKNHEFKKIVSTKNFLIPMEGESWARTLKNHNKLLWLYDGCNGVKTGYTKKSGRCLVSSAERDGQKLICVTLNAPDDWNDHTYLLDYGFNQFNTLELARVGDKAADYMYNPKYGKSVELIYAENYKVAIKTEDCVTTTLRFEKLKLPVKKGTVAGYMDVFCNGEKIGEIELLTNKKLEKTKLIEKINLYMKKIFR